MSIEMSTPLHTALLISLSAFMVEVVDVAALVWIVKGGSDGNGSLDLRMTTGSVSSSSDKVMLASEGDNK